MHNLLTCNISPGLLPGLSRLGWGFRAESWVARRGRGGFASAGGVGLKLSGLFRAEFPARAKGVAS